MHMAGTYAAAPIGLQQEDGLTDMQTDSLLLDNMEWKQHFPFDEL